MEADHECCSQYILHRIRLLLAGAKASRRIIGNAIKGDRVQEMRSTSNLGHPSQIPKFSKNNKQTKEFESRPPTTPIRQSALVPPLPPATPLVSSCPNHPSPIPFPPNAESSPLPPTARNPKNHTPPFRIPHNTPLPSPAKPQANASEMRNAASGHPKQSATRSKCRRNGRRSPRLKVSFGKKENRREYRRELGGVWLVGFLWGGRMVTGEGGGGRGAVEDGD